MDENTNVVDNIVNNSYVTPNGNDDSMFVMLFKTVVVVLIGGLIVKLFRRFVNWVKEGQRLRKAEKERKESAKFDEAVNKKSKELLDEYLASQVKESEKDSEKKE